MSAVSYAAHVRLCKNTDEEKAAPAGVTKKNAPGQRVGSTAGREERNHNMSNVRPHLLLNKPRPPGKESDCEREALRFLRSWKRARERQAIQARVNDAEKNAQPKPKRSTVAGAA